MKKKTRTKSEIGKSAKAQGRRHEVAFAKWCVKNAGGLHPDVEKVATSTGRVGNLFYLEIDGVFVIYSMESKSKTTKLPKWLSKGFYQAIHAAAKYGNAPLITWYFGEFAPKFRRWHTITQERHEELLNYERIVKRGISEIDR